METVTNKTNRWVVVGRIAFTIALLCTVAFIFHNSLQVGAVSSGASGQVLSGVQSVVSHFGAPSLATQITEHMIRKAAHLAEYMLMGFWLMLCLRVYTRHFVRHVSWPMLAGLFVAVTDETIQLYTPGRSSNITDIWIDFAGVLMGLAVAFLLLCLCRMCYILYKHRDEV